MIPLRKLIPPAALLLAICPTTGVAQNDLITASRAGDLSQVRALIAASGDVNAKRGAGVTALIAASEQITWRWCEPCSRHQPM